MKRYEKVWVGFGIASALMAMTPNLGIFEPPWFIELPWDIGSIPYLAIANSIPYGYAIFYESHNCYGAVQETYWVGFYLLLTAMFFWLAFRLRILGCFTSRKNSQN